ncbi:hypothetical protein H109_06898 [Trichophyton interdigitale MR816]|uniref:F-box domain-containing protein n=1 Tax=Trichophyton interdigitale (strain MR816) TaxID=1215338 RepID=A0A059IZW0_TRIIM|nr:hypothetical protein H109_06898 [Trichophyton interdigitale MR816]
MACMLDLPAELVFPILDELCTIHPPSLVAFACTSKRSHHLSKQVLTVGHYHTLAFKVDLTRLSDDVKQCTLELERDKGAFDAVRCLIIETIECTSLKIYDRDEDLSKRPLFRWKRYDTLQRQEIDSPTRYYNYPWPESERCDLDHGSWMPLVGLLRRLPQLADLVFVGQTQFPPCMLNALHTSIPSCRLFLHNFMLRSIAQGDRLDEYDYKLVTSPCLYGLTISYYDVQGHDELYSFHQEAIQRMVYGLSPNLKEIHIDRNRLGGFALQFSLKPAYSRDQHWQGFTSDKKLPGTFQKGALEHIVLSKRETDIRKRDIESWSEYTDFSKLRVLRLCPHLCDIQENVLEYLSTCNFASLETFELWMGEFSQSSWFPLPCSSSFASATKRFLEQLPALSTLKLQDWDPKLGLDVLQYSNLRKLHLKPAVGSSISLNDLNRLAKYCPILSTLVITLRRLRGNADEVKMYKVLGSMARLAYLDLLLDVKDPKFRWGGRGKGVDTPSDPSFDNFDREFYPQITLGYYKCPRKGHLRDVLINSALDADLVCSIFRTINSTKPDISVLLKKMTISVDTRELSNTFDGAGSELYYNVLRYLGAEWTVERNYSDLTMDNLIATRTGNEGIEWNQCFQSCDDTCLDPDLCAVFHNLWPSKGESSGAHDWHSFPLATGNNEAEIERWLNRNKSG